MKLMLKNCLTSIYRALPFVFFAIFVFIFIYCWFDLFTLSNNSDFVCSGFTTGRIVIDSDKYQLVEAKNSFVLFEKKENSKYVSIHPSMNGYELIKIKSSDNSTELIDYVIENSKIYSLYFSR